MCTVVAVAAAAVGRTFDTVIVESNLKDTYNHRFALPHPDAGVASAHRIMKTSTECLSTSSDSIAPGVRSY